MNTPLRTQFINHLTLQRRSPKTKEAYISAVYGLACLRQVGQILYDIA